MNLFESLKTLRGGSVKTQIDSSLESGVFDGVSSQAIVDLISSMKSVSSKRHEVYEDVREMLNDSVVGSAVELIAEDSTQLDRDKMHTCWAVSMEGDKDVYDSEVCITVNDFLYNIFDVDSKLFAIAYHLVAYGECYIRTYSSDIETEKAKPKKEQRKNFIDRDGQLYEIVTDPEQVKDILEFGETVGFLYEDDKRKVLYPTDEFIHFCNDTGLKRESVSIKYRPDGAEKEIERDFKVRVGESFIDKAREAFGVLQLLEMILLMARFNKSALYRLFKIEVGGATRIEIRKIIAEFKRNLNSAETINLPASTFKSKAQGIPYGGSIYVPVKNGKGDVQVDTVGGDWDLKEILDLEYWRNKLFAALKVPKAYLGDEESIAGGIANQSLVRLDIRYARMVKRAMGCLVRGTKQVCDNYLNKIGHSDWCDKYAIEFPVILTSEESDRADAITTNLNVATSVSQMLETDEEIDKHEMNKYLMSEIVGLDALWQKIDMRGKQPKNNTEEEPYEEPEE